MGTNGATERAAMRLGLALVLALTAACSGSGATVAESDLRGQNTKQVTATTPDDPTPVAPATTTFTCKTGSPFYDGAIHSVTFSLRGDELASHVTAAPATSMLGELDDASETTHDGGRFVLGGANGDAELVLFDNSDMTRGYVSVNGKHADVFCTKTK